MLRDRARTQYGYADNSNDLKLLMLSDAPSSSPMAGAAARVPLRLKHTQLAAILTFAAEIKATSGKTKLLRQLISCSSYPRYRVRHQACRHESGLLGCHLCLPTLLRVPPQALSEGDGAAAGRAVARQTLIPSENVS